MLSQVALWVKDLVWGEMGEITVANQAAAYIGADQKTRNYNDTAALQPPTPGSGTGTGTAPPSLPLCIHGSGTGAGIGTGSQQDEHSNMKTASKKRQSGTKIIYKHFYG